MYLLRVTLAETKLELSSHYSRIAARREGKIIGGVVGQVFELLLQFMSQLGGGPGPPENNLVRFALPAIFWGVLLAVAWSRQRQSHLPRERLLVWGFGLALLRELVMLVHWITKISGVPQQPILGSWTEPVEHALAIASVFIIATAFLRYILDDPDLSRRYLIYGLALIAVCFLASFIWLSIQPAGAVDARFHQTLAAITLHTASSILIIVAILILIRQHGWLSYVVVLALAFLFLGEFLILLNHLSGQVYNYILCPIANNFHIWAVPLFGFVYFREQALEKRQAEQELHAYQGRLEELVTERTAELIKANKKLERAAVLEERQRIAAEMHDGLAQTLSTLALKTGQAEDLLQDGQVQLVLDDFEQMQKILRQAVIDVRRSIASLQESPQPPCALQDALAKSVTDGGDIDLQINDRLPAPLFLPTNVQTQVLFILREALHNACRHAEARKVTITLDRQQDKYRIVVEDDGRGFDPVQEASNGSNHFGLSIMAARAARIGGQLKIDSKLGKHTRVRLTWPAEPQEVKYVGHVPVQELELLKGV